jgi:hypothetical protein
MLRDSRTVPRYFLTPALDGFIDGQPVRVIDVGLKGVRVELYSPLPPARSVTLVFASIALQAQVLWCQVDSLNFVLEQDQYLAGLVFEERNPLIEELMVLLMEREAAIPITENRSADRYRITAPLTGSFGDVAPVSLIDLSIRGARISTPTAVIPMTSERLRFQVDEDAGPVDLISTVMWCRPSDNAREYHVGLSIADAEEQMRRNILRLCMRNEARIELDSLKRKFDALRVAGRTAALQELAV